MSVRSAAVAILLVSASGSAVAQSAHDTNAALPPPPPAVAIVAFKAAPYMQAVLDVQALDAKPIETLTPVKARIQPTAADAAMAVMDNQGMSVAPDPAVAAQDIPYGTDAMQFARVYKPVALAGSGALPVIIYYTMLKTM